MIIRPGLRFRSAVSTVELIVVRAPAGDVALACGGVLMLTDGAASAATDATLDPALADDLQVGKRYSEEAAGLEVLCTKPGVGTLTCDGVALAPKDAKPLPASD